MDPKGVLSVISNEKDGEVMYVDINDIWLLRVSREPVVTGKLGYS
jgi:hypothetical protein